MNILGVILARAGSKGLPDKCVRDLLGRPVITYTFDHADSALRITHLVLTSDSEPAKELARAAGIEVIDRPAELAHDLATVDAVARHAVETWERRQAETRREKGQVAAIDVVVLLYGNIPVRVEGLIDRVVERLIATGADSVRSVAPVSKQHPDWIHRLDGDRMVQFRKNCIYRRQDLEPLYYHDGAVIAVTRAALFAAVQTPDDHQSFLGHDRRAIIQRCEDAVDIDEAIDLHLAEAVIRARGAGAPRAKHAHAIPTPEALLKEQWHTAHQMTSPDPLLKEQWHNGGFPSIAIGRHRVGHGQPVFIVAEAGVNHNGRLDTALRLVDAAIEAGANAVKFQMFNADTLAAACAPTAAYQRGAQKNGSQREMLRKLELSFADFVKIKTHCDARRITFLVTPFGIKELQALQQFGVQAVKIASTDVTNEPLLLAAAKTGLPLIVSTGASTSEEIDECVSRLDEGGGISRLILLHCVSAYPSPMEAMNLRAIAALEQRFGVPCGLSDHSVSLRMGAWAVAADACVLEKHFTLDRNQDGPDHAMSLEPGQLAEYVGEVRNAEQALGSGQLGFSPLEAEVRDVARKSVFAATDIPAGAMLTEDHLALKRPGRGLPPKELARLIGRRAAVDISRDTPLSWELVK